ncbi:chorismate mutase [Paenibacillus tarimensis]
MGQYKIINRLPIYDPVREEQIIADLLQKNSGPLDNDSVREVFKKIFDTSTQLQEKNKHVLTENEN